MGAVMIANVLTDLHRKLLNHLGRSIPTVASDNKARGGLARSRRGGTR